MLLIIIKKNKKKMSTKVEFYKTYYSPFPREKSNNEVLKNSYKKRINNKTAIIDIPPQITVSYMKKNPFYFDLKKNEKTQKKKKRQNSSYKKPGYNIYSNKKLQDIFSKTGKKFFSEDFKNKISPGCEIIKVHEKNNKIPEEERKKLTSQDILKILNKIKLPPQYKNKGKVPKYIHEFKIRQFIEREYERLVEEEKGYPKGTFKVFEGDRILILENLKILREKLIEELNLFPVDYFLRAVGIRNRRAEIERKLDEIEYAIKIFGLHDVFLKIC